MTDVANVDDELIFMSGLSDTVKASRLSYVYWRNRSEYRRALMCSEASDEAGTYREILQRETAFHNNREEQGFTGVCISPNILLNGTLTWAEYALGRAKKQSGLRILDLGTGAKANLWTTPLDDSRLDDRMKSFLLAKIPTHLVTQSAGEQPANTTALHINRSHLAGHFINVCDYLIGIGERFDIVLSRMAMYQTCLVIPLLEKITHLLVPGGAAFLETIRRDKSDHVVLIPREKSWLYTGPGFIDRDGLFRDGVSFKDAGIYGLPWVYRNPGLGGTDHVAFIKEQFDVKLKPKFISMSLYNPQIETFVGPYLLYESRIKE